MNPTAKRPRFLLQGGWQLVCAGAFTLCEWGHLLNERTRSFELLDTVFHWVGIPLKILTLVCVLLMLSRVLERCHRDAWTACRVGAGWLLSGLLLLGGSSAARETLDPWLSNAQDKFYPVTRHTLETYTAGGYTFWGDGAERFLARWQSGEIFMQEALLLFTAILGLVAIGYFLGSLAPARTVLAVGWLVFILFVGKLAFGMIAFDVDNFIGGSLMGCLFYDVVIPVIPLSAVSPIASLVYLLMIATPLLALRPLASRVPEGLDPGAHAGPAVGEAEDTLQTMRQ